MTLYKNKYRIESARCPYWNYSANGWYFITICTHNRQHFFGTIQNGTMQLSSIGQIVAEEWQKTAMIRPYVVLDEWVVMPNHFHAIVGIQNTGRLELPHSPDDTVETFRRNVSLPGFRVCNQNHWGRSSDNSNPCVPNIYGQPDTQNSHGNPDFTTTSFETPSPSIVSANTSKPIPNAGKPINSTLDRPSRPSTP